VAWWDIERPDEVHTIKYAREVVPDIAILAPDLVRIRLYEREVDEVIELDEAIVRDIGSWDYAYLESMIDDPVPFDYLIFEWQTSSNDREMYTFDESFTEAGSYPIDRDRRISHTTHPDGGRHWFEGDVPEGTHPDDVYAHYRQVLKLTHPDLDFEVVSFDLEGREELLEQYDRAHVWGVTGDGRLVIAVDDQVVFWSAGEEPVTVDLPSGGVSEDSEDGSAAENHPAYLYGLDDGRLLMVYDNGNLTTWDLSETVPVPTVQFTVDWVGRTSMARSGKFTDLPSVEVTNDGHVIVQSFRNQDRARIRHELQIVKLAPPP
jgi:hypothetical protein